jgi:hypothetical protein
MNSKTLNEIHIKATLGKTLLDKEEMTWQY